MRTTFGSRRWVTAALVVLSVHAVVLTQSAADFSGKWMPIAGRSQPNYLRDGPGVTITQTSETIAIQFGNEPLRTYRLDGEATRREDKENGVTHTITSRTLWVGTKLTITEQRQGWKREHSYFFDVGRPTELTITSATTLLHTRNGELTVSTIGPSARVYRKGSEALHQTAAGAIIGGTAERERHDRGKNRYGK
jgi:hypothetical protein